MGKPQPDVLTNLFARLLAQVRYAGRLAVPGGISFERLRDQIFPRALVAGALGDALETNGFTGFMPDGATLWNPLDWPDSKPPAGNLRDTKLSAAQYIASIIEAWTLQDREPVFFAHLTVRATLWILREAGIIAGLEFLIDLQRDGVLIRTQIAIFAAYSLFIARRAVKDDADVIALFGDPAISEPQAWMLQTGKAFDPAAPTLRDDVDDDFWYVLDRVKSEMQQVRAARNYDEWLTGQAWLNTLTSFAKALFQAVGASDALPFLAPLDQIEEVRADTGSAMAVTRSLGAAGWCYAPIYMIARAYAPESAMDTVARIVEQRVVIPQALTAYFWDPLHHSQHPPEWARMSTTLAPIYGRAVLGDQYFQVRRSTPFTEEQARVLGRAPEMFHDLPLEENVRSDVLVAVDTSNSRIRAREQCGHYGIAEADVDRTIDELIARSCEAEAAAYVQIIGERIEAHDTEAVRNTADLFVARFPWCAAAHAARASAGDAFDSAVEAIVLDPIPFAAWEALGGMLRASGDGKQANVAESVAQRLRAQQNVPAASVGSRAP